MPQKHPFAVTNFHKLCTAEERKCRYAQRRRVIDLYESCTFARDSFRKRVKLDLWRAVERVLGFYPIGEAGDLHCACLNCARPKRLLPERPRKPPDVVEKNRVRSYKQKRIDHAHPEP